MNCVCEKHSVWQVYLSPRLGLPNKNLNSFPYKAPFIKKRATRGTSGLVFKLGLGVRSSGGFHYHVSKIYAINDLKLLASECAVSVNPTQSQQY